MQYGIDAKVGNITVFTREGAINAYKGMAKRCYADLSLASSVVLSECGRDMHRLGFSWEEIEAMELEAIEENGKDEERC